MRSIRNVMSLAVAAAAVACVATPERLLATAPNVTYTASGTFATPPMSGNDLFMLQGQPFSISLVANAALVPTTHGAHWATYSNLTMSGTVQSALLPTPIAIASNKANLELATGNPNVDIFVMEAPVQVVGLQIIIVATVQMPKGTIPSALIHPFTAPVTMTSTNANMTYANGTSVTKLGLNGTLNATIPGMAQTAGGAMLYTAAAQSITSHADGTMSARSLGRGPVSTGAPTDNVVLMFYASGVSGASNVQVQVGGQDVPVLYAGAAASFRGLDQISVQLPHAFAGRGPVDVLLTADGKTASPVQLQIQ